MNYMYFKILFTYCQDIVLLWVN